MTVNDICKNIDAEIVCGDTSKDVEAMVAPLRAALSRNPDELNGQIIFQKDGFSMSRHTPVAEALPLQLALLAEYGYEVITNQIR